MRSDLYVGLKQGRVMSPLEFHVNMDGVLGEMKDERSGCGERVGSREIFVCGLLRLVIGFGTDFECKCNISTSFWLGTHMNCVVSLTGKEMEKLFKVLNI